MLRALPGGRARESEPDLPTLAPEKAGADKLALLAALEKKVLWLSTWMIHNANHVRPSRDGLKVGGHQASSASVATLMTALYLDVMQPQDRVAVKPHAAPVFHALQYLLGRQSRDRLERFRGFGGVQSYPSRTKDGADIVDFSTGSVGLGVGITLFASLVQDYLRLHRMVPTDAPPGRMIALAGDAELDEGNIFEALLEGWKHDVRNLWWIIDYNRQSLDAVVSDRLFGRIDALFEMFGWRVVTLKYGRLLQSSLRAARRRAAARMDRRLPELALFGAGLQGRRGLARAFEARPEPLSRHPRDPRRARRPGAGAADDQPRRARSRFGARRVSRRHR